MNRRYALPVAIALTCHAVLFLGSGKPPEKAPVPATPSAPPDEIGKLMELLKPENAPAPSSEEPGLHNDSPTIERPISLRELPPVGDPDMRAITEAYVPGDPGTGAKLTPDALGPGNGSGSESKILTVDQLDEIPQARFQKAPTYPAMLKNDQITGSVVVAFVVDENGRVHNVRVLKTSDDRFNAATVAAVSEWRFAPGKKKGLPVRFRMSVPVMFRLDGV